MRARASYLVVLAGIALVSALWTATPDAAPKASPQSATAAPPPPTLTAASEKQLLDRYCLGCHNEKARTAGVDSARKLALDSLDRTRVSRDATTWALVVRKLRAGMMPPAG